VYALNWRRHGRVRRSYIANPDLVERLATGAPLAEIGWETVYASGPHGYSDYPTIRHAAARFTPR
jgi:hypothetical protein